MSIVRSTTDRRWVQFEWHQLAFVSSVVCDKSNCDLRGGDTLTIELRRVLLGVLREPGKVMRVCDKSRFIEGDTRHAVEVENQIYCMLNVLY